MSDLPQGYADVPEEDRKKAQKFFDFAKGAADTGNFDYAIELYLQGIERDPENTEAHQQLRDISLKRKASGGKDLGMMEKMKLRRSSKEDKENLLNAEKLLAYNPGDTATMLALTVASHKAGFYDTAMWIGKITQDANVTHPKGPDYNTFITLRDIYKSLHQWPQAVEACSWASKLKPNDMDLQKELKDLGAQQTMSQGKYESGKSFRDSIRDMAGQRELMVSDSDVRTLDMMQQQIVKAEAEYKAEPNEAGKLMKYVDALRKTESMEHENVAIEVLEEAFKRTKQFRFRKSIGEIKLVQLSRMERTMRQAYQADPADAELKKQYQQFMREKVEEELAEYTLWAENYPTETGFRFNMSKNLFLLGRFDEAIPIFQNVRQDPKYRGEASTFLGRAFMEAGFADEAVDTLREATEAYPVKGDLKSIEMTYYYARALEAKGDIPTAIKQYSQVAQWNFNYRDVQVRIKGLRTKPQA
ncbi:MAG: tetratricopeptide repeat protein [Tepidisphaeraceae bacterium]